MTDAVAPAPAGSMLPAAPALNTPEGMAARKNTHPAMRGQVQPGTELPAAPTPAAPTPAAPTPAAPTPAAPTPAPAPPAPAVPATSAPAPATNLLTPAAPPPLQYAAPATTATPAVDAEIAAIQKELAEQRAIAQKAQADQARHALLNPTIDWSAIGDVPEDQAQALNAGLVRPQLENIVNHFEAQLNAQQQRHEQALAEFKNVGASVAEVAHQQEVNQNLSMARLNSQILAEHPTFATDMADPTFIANAGVYHNEITQAYAAGNAAQVNQAMSYVKSLMTPPPSGVEGSVVGGPTATTSPPPADEGDTYKQSDSRAAFEAYQRNEMSRADYLAFAAAFKDAMKAGRVTDG